MTPEMILFILVALITLTAAILVMTSRNILHAALWLILALFGVAAMYVILNLGFFAMAQVIIYVGAISILFIFAIMLVSQQNSVRRFNEDWLMALILAGVLFGGLVWLLSRWSGFGVTAPATATAELIKTDPVRQLGAALVSPQGYLIPFEVASLLLIAAMIGAIYVAWGKTLRKKKEDEK
jgi:NADH-quinone oxidoreductase subunit J